MKNYPSSTRGGAHRPVAGLMPASRARVRAFTLIEIMVVVVILGILAATIIPNSSALRTTPE